MQQTKKNIIIVASVLIVLAVIGTVAIVNNVKAKKQITLENQYFGGDTKSPDWANMTDKTSELQADFEKELKSSYAATITQEENTGDFLTYKIIIPTGMDRDKLFSDVQKLYTKYRAKGYKGRLHIYEEENYLYSIPRVARK